MNDVLLLGLATWHAVEVYHHGSIFADVRAWFESNVASGSRVLRFLTALTGCPFCLSLWVAGALTVYYHLVPGLLGLVPVAILAAARVSNLMNDLFHGFCRTPR